MRVVCVHFSNTVHIMFSFRVQAVQAVMVGSDRRHMQHLRLDLILGKVLVYKDLTFPLQSCSFIAKCKVPAGAAQINEANSQISCCLTPLFMDTTSMSLLYIMTMSS